MYARMWLLLLFILLIVGCSQQLDVPDISPGDVVDSVMREYDTNKDGALDAKELARCPGLQSALARSKTGKDRFTRDQLQEYFDAYKSSGIGLQVVHCRVTLDKAPLVGATVVAEPENFMGRNIKSARGVTNEKGQAQLTIDGAASPGCNLGIYRVRITAPAGGRELPARYNTNSELGLEVAPGTAGSTTFHLSTK